MLVRRRSWTVVRLTTYADCEALRIADGADPSARRTLLLPFDRPRRLDDRRLEIVSARAWLHAFRRLLTAAYPFGGLRQCPHGIDVLPYQLEPAIAVLRDGHARVLIADAVGLGKTIEAGIVLRELSERHEGFRALVLAPAGLRTQWGDELAARFGIATTGADAGWLRAIARTLPPDVNPWSTPGTYVASFDFVKRPEALRALEDVHWDLVVVDEAHAAAATTDRRAAIDAVARRARRVILLTATPPSEPAELEALCRIGAPAGDPDIVMFSRGRASQGARSRRSVVLPVRLTSAERRMHRLLARYTALVWKEARGRGNAPGRLVATLLRKRALSSGGALAISVRRRLELLDAGEPPSEIQLLLPLMEDDAREDAVSDGVLGAAGLRSADTERRWLRTILAAAELASARESKLRVLATLLRRIREPAIVFTEYRDTLERLRTLLLASRVSTCVVHGGLSPVERTEVLAAFARGGTTLLTTDAAAEGLNLQRTCRVVVHFELPWNPARLLQRAGRVDRIGQRRRVHEIALVARDTAEAVVLSPIARRVMPSYDGGDRRLIELLTESRVASTIFEGRPPEPSRSSAAPPVVTPTLAADSIVDALRLQRLRAALRDTAAASAASHAIAVATLRRWGLAPGVVLVFDVEVIDPAANDILERAVAAVHVEVAGGVWPRRPVHLKTRIAEVLPAILRAAAPAVDDVAARRLSAVRPRFALAASRIAARERRVREETSSAARELVQAGLFERPWHRVAASRRETGSSTARAAEQLHAQPGDTPSPIASATLRALLVVSRR